MSVLLAGDIGGTKTNLAVFSPDAGLDAPLVEESLPSGHYPSLEALIAAFLEKVDLTLDKASFGVAGPVVGGKATVTNLPWVIEAERLRQMLHLSEVRLLNDLQAIAHSIPYLRADDLSTLNGGVPEQHGTLAVIAPGTGLGEAFLTWDGTRYRAHASEGGHVDFAPTSELEVNLLRYLMHRGDHVSYERICSGIGIPNIYAFLRDSHYAEEPAWLAARLAAAESPTPIIVQSALAGTPTGHGEEGPSALCMATLDLFVSALAAEAGNLALKVLATGGVYVGGGIPPRILSLLGGDRFMAPFRRKGRFFELLSRMPVHVIRNPRSALLGAAAHGLEERTAG
jgi:glucokinase